MSFQSNSLNKMYSNNNNESEEELLFLMLHFLKNNGFNSSANSLESELKERISNRHTNNDDWDEKDSDINYESLLQKHRNPPTTLLPQLMNFASKQLQRGINNSQRNQSFLNNLYNYRYQSIMSYKKLRMKDTNRLILKDDSASIYPSSGDNMLLKTEFSSYKVLAERFGHLSAVCCICFSNDDVSVITGGDDGLVKSWNTSTGKLERIFFKFNAELNDVSYSPDNKLIAGASADFIIRLWENISAKPIFIYTNHSASVMRVRFTPKNAWNNGKRFMLSASLDGTCRIWNCDNLDINPLIITDPLAISTLIQKPFEFLSCCWHPNGMEFACGSNDNICRIYSIKYDKYNNLSWNCIAMLRGNLDEVQHVEYYRNGDILLSEDTKSVFIWVRNKTDENVTYYLHSVIMRTNLKLCKSVNICRLSSNSSFLVGAFVTTQENNSFKGGFNAWKLPNKYDLSTSNISYVTDNDDLKFRISQTAVCNYDRTIINGAIKAKHPFHQVNYNINYNYMPIDTIKRKSSFQVICPHPCYDDVFVIADDISQIFFWRITSNNIILLNKIVLNTRFAFLDGNFNTYGTKLALSTNNGRLFLIGTGSRSLYYTNPVVQFTNLDYKIMDTDDHGNLLDMDSKLRPHEVFSTSDEAKLCDAEGIKYQELALRLNYDDNVVDNIMDHIVKSRLYHRILHNSKIMGTLILGNSIFVQDIRYEGIDNIAMQFTPRIKTLLQSIRRTASSRRDPNQMITFEGDELSTLHETAWISDIAKKAAIAVFNGNDIKKKFQFDQDSDDEDYQSFGDKIKSRKVHYRVAMIRPINAEGVLENAEDVNNSDAEEDVPMADETFSDNEDDSNFEADSNEDEDSTSESEEDPMTDEWDSEEEEDYEGPTNFTRKRKRQNLVATRASTRRKTSVQYEDFETIDASDYYDDYDNESSDNSDEERAREMMEEKKRKDNEMKARLERKKQEKRLQKQREEEARQETALKQQVKLIPKSSWLLRHCNEYPIYIPQLGDEVFYFKEGHINFIHNDTLTAKVQKSLLKEANECGLDWNLYPDNCPLLCKITELEYIFPKTIELLDENGNYHVAVKLKLKINKEQPFLVTPPKRRLSKRITNNDEVKEDEEIQNPWKFPDIDFIWYKSNSPDYIVLSSRLLSGLNLNWEVNDIFKIYYPDEKKWYRGIVLDNSAPTIEEIQKLVNKSTRGKIDYTKPMLPTCWSSVKGEWLEDNSSDIFSPWELTPDNDSEKFIFVSDILMKNSILKNEKITWDETCIPTVQNKNPNAYLIKIEAQVFLEIKIIENCTHFINKIIEQDKYWKWAYDFVYSIEDLYPDNIELIFTYKTMIPVEINLSLILSRLNSNYYRDIISLLSDINYVYLNAQHYNVEGSAIYLNAARLKKCLYYAVLHDLNAEMIEDLDQIYPNLDISLTFDDIKRTDRTNIEKILKSN